MRSVLLNLFGLLFRWLLVLAIPLDEILLEIASVFPVTEQILARRLILAVQRSSLAVLLVLAGRQVFEPLLES